MPARSGGGIRQLHAPARRRAGSNPFAADRVVRCLIRRIHRAALCGNTAGSRLRGDSVVIAVPDVEAEYASGDIHRPAVAVDAAVPRYSAVAAPAGDLRRTARLARAPVLLRVAHGPSNQLAAAAAIDGRTHSRRTAD